MGWLDRSLCRTPHATRAQLAMPRHHVLIIVCRNGVTQVHVACDDCGQRTGALAKDRWVEAVLAYPHAIRTQDNSTDARYPACSVHGCDTPGMEQHHFAPVNTFGWDEAERWPLLPLCKEHHRHWHRTMDGYRWNARGIDAA